MIDIKPLDQETLALGMDALCVRDKDLAEIVARVGAPPLWARQPGFPTLLKIILEQQVSLASARATYEKLLAVTGPLTPDRFLALDEQTLRAVGFSRQKAGYGRALATDIVEGRFDVGALETLPDEQARAELIKRKGIGPWTAEIYLLMALRRPDTWPMGDLALQIAMQEIKGLEQRPAPAAMEALAEPWRPWRAVAARLLWRHYLTR